IYFFVTALALLSLAQISHAFSFEEHETQEKREETTRLEAERTEIHNLMAIPCKSELKEKKIAVIIGELHADGRMTTKQSNYGLLFQEINKRMRHVGMRTYTQEEITEHIAQAEIDAFLSNNMDAAASAATRLKADFILRGMIHSRTNVNPVIGIKEVFISMAFTLVDSSGRIISDVTAKGDSFSGQDTISVTLDLVKTKADSVVARLYHDYCASISKSGRPTGQHDKGVVVKDVKDF
ncbi:MAG: hypothetical protein KAI35_04060, partial [Desulfobulbaceae bacterium]|nr:hypothetical protein [Desulfobulbaceae bacterium]